MFGYIKTDFPNMYVKDTVLYKASYCGLCKSIGEVSGVSGRFCLNYDLTFLSVFLHNVLDMDMEIVKEHCILHHFKKRPISKPNELSKKIGALNVILAFYKIKDDIADIKKGKLKKAFLLKAYKKAKKFDNNLDKIVNKNYQRLLKLEKENCSSIDISSDPFGKMMSDIFEYFLQEKFNEKYYAVAYSLGKWIYLIDALDDFDKDIKKKNYNVFVNSFKDSNTKQVLLEKHNKEIIQVFSSLLFDIKSNLEEISFNFNHDLIDNILLNGLNVQTKSIMENLKCKKKTIKS